MSERNPTSMVPEQQNPDESTIPVPFADRAVLQFNIDEYRPKAHRTLSRFFSGRRQTTDTSAQSPILTSLPRTRKSAADWGWQALMVGLSLLLVFGIGRLIVSNVQDPYPGVSQCHQIELWMYGVDSDAARIEWAVEDAENEVSNDAEAKEATARLDQMFRDLRTSLTNTSAPEEVTELKALWLRVIDLVLQISDANQRGDSATATSLKKDWNVALVQRLEEKKRVLGDCRLQIEDVP